MYRKVLSSRLSRLVAHLRIFWLFIKRKFDAHDAVNIDKSSQNWIVDCTVHIGAFCQFTFWWIYYCHSIKSTGKETGKTHLCAVVRFSSFFSGGLITATVVNPLERKLANAPLWTSLLLTTLWYCPVLDQRGSHANNASITLINHVY